MPPIKSHTCWCVEFDSYEQLHLYEDGVLPLQRAVDVADRLRELIDSNPAEANVQSFLEKHPRCLPETGRFHNGLRADVVISKLPLHNDFVTDFAYMSVNSQYTRVTCVEIERPGMKLFRQDGSFSAEYLHARQQVIDWNFWAQYNVKEALKLFGKYGQHLDLDSEYLQIHCILIAGRRAQVSTTKRKQRWAAEAAVLPRAIDIMTYDRLLDMTSDRLNQAQNEKILVCSYRDRSLRVKHVTS